MHKPTVYQKFDWDGTTVHIVRSEHGMVDVEIIDRDSCDFRTMNFQDFVLRLRKAITGPSEWDDGNGEGCV